MLDELNRGARAAVAKVTARANLKQGPLELAPAATGTKKKEPIKPPVWAGHEA